MGFAGIEKRKVKDMTRTCLALTLAATLLTAGTALAHHSLTPFDREKTVTLTGTVKELQWTNPHIWIEIVIDDDETMSWSIQGSSPQILARSGWRPTFLHAGDQISLGIHPRKDGLLGGYIADEEALVVNGHELVAPLMRGHDSEEPF
jgi:hypothetical protein